MQTEQLVASHYARPGLEQAILDALARSGKNIDALSASDLSGADEFHLGWRQATVELARNLGLAQGVELLDIGCGIGGPARFFAEFSDCRVTGIDLTADYVQTATALTRRCGLAEKVHFKQASALALPFAENTFDVATMIHVGMNIEAKAKLFKEARRVLRQDGHFAVYDIMKTSAAELPFPMPWAETAATSFVVPPETYHELLVASGFEITQEHNRRELALTLGREMRENAAKHGAPPLGLHLLMGPATPQRLGNVMGALQQGLIAPIEIIARAA
jgi:ubiquinone/menaquinone biosynthesis C-methylase UbiE